jgi:hypothetical protein
MAVLGFADDPEGTALVRETIRAAVIVDALIGTGASLPIRGSVQRILQSLSETLRRPDRPIDQAVVAVDLPSGLHADSGSVDPLTPSADLTVTFASFPAPATLANWSLPTSALTPLTRARFLSPLPPHPALRACSPPGLGTRTRAPLAKPS